jgi:hypothetical protein
VPPECIFPEAKDAAGGRDLRRNLITVPSCAEHNLKKGADDIYLMWVMCCNLSANSASLTPTIGPIPPWMRLQDRGGLIPPATPADEPVSGLGHGSGCALNRAAE